MTATTVSGPGWFDPELDWVLVHRLRHGVPVTSGEIGEQLGPLSAVLISQHGWTVAQLANAIGANPLRIRRYLERHTGTPQPQGVSAA